MYHSFFFSIYNVVVASPLLSKLAVFCAVTLPYITLIASVVFLIFHHDLSISKESPWRMFRRKMSEMCLVFGSVFFSWSLVEIVKWIVAAPRPFLYFASVNPLITFGGYDSFPSGHAAFYAALATALTLYHPRTGTLFYLLALVIGVSRIAVGVHYPVDVLAGFAFGVVVTYATYHALLTIDFIKKPAQ